MVGGPRRAPPGLSPPPPSQPASPFLSLEAAAEQSLLLSGGRGTRDPDLDNMDTFATASAVAAGVLDMGGDTGGNTAAVQVPPLSDRWGAALNAGAVAGGSADDSRHERSFSVPSNYFGRSHASPRAVAAAAAAATAAAGGNGAPYGEQRDLAIRGGGGTSVFDGALEQGHYAHRQGGRACRAPAGTVGGSGGVGCDGGRGSRLGLYMSSSAGNGGGESGGDAQEVLSEGARQFETPRGGGSLYFGGSGPSGAGGPDVSGFEKEGDNKYNS